MSTAHFLEIIAEHTGDIIAIYTLDLKYFLVSISCKRILGYDQQDLIGHSFYEKMHPEDVTRVLNSIKELSTQSITYRIQRNDDAYVWIETILQKISDKKLSAAPMILAVSKDITTRKSSEEMVNKFVEGVQYASDCIVMTNPNGQVMYVNPTVKEITGYTPEEIIGKHANVIWAGLNNPTEIEKMWDTLKNKKTRYTGENSSLTKDGKTYFTEVHIAPIFNQNREVTFYVGVSRDTTKAKEVDRMKNEFLSLASHQLRTPLTAIKWRLEMLRGKSFEQLAPEQKTYIKDIDTSNERMIELVNSLLNISRIESGKLIIDPKMTSLEELMLSALDDLEIKIKEKNIKLRLSFQTNIYDVCVDRRLMSNVFMNLLSNATKYTPNEGNIEISIYTEGDNIITKIADSGYGIPEDDQPKIFEKFFRAKNVSRVETEGTGLGLYLVKAVVEASGGKVWFESEENKGTTFYVSMSAKNGGDTLLNHSA